jgi:diguanylate cyclase (GGDEF)-like protein/PAS domain S-box-containing protein
VRSLRFQSNETERLKALHSLHLLDTARESAFDDIARLAAVICGTRMAAISFIDESRLWLKAELGLGVRETPRASSFCTHTIQRPEPLVIADTHDDERFRAYPEVLEPPGIRSYAGAPLLTRDGFAVGALCVLDPEPRSLTPVQLESLSALGRQVEYLIELRIKNQQLSRSERQARLLHHSARVLGSVPFKAAVGEVLRELCQATSMHAAALWLANSNGSLRAVGDPYSVDSRAAEFTQEVVLPSATSLPGRAVRHGRSLWIRDVVRAPGLHRAGNALAAGLRTGIAVPIRSGEAVVGAFELLSRDDLERDDALVALQALDVASGRVGWLSASALDAIVVADASGSVISWNKAAENLFGFGFDEMLGQPLSAIIPERHRTAHLRGLAAVAVGAESRLSGQLIELTAMCKSGEEIPIELALSMWTESDARFFGAIIRDIRQAKAATSALRNERDFIAAVLDTVRNLIVVLDRTGQVVRFNRACELLTGYAEAELLSKPLWDLLLVPEEREALRARFMQLTANDFPSTRESHWLTRKGERRLIAWSNTALLDADGNPEFVIGTGVDVTEARAVEKMILEQSATMASVLENMSDGVIVTDAVGRIVLCNEAAERMLGRARVAFEADAEANVYHYFEGDALTPCVPARIPLVRALRGEHVEQAELYFSFPGNEGRWHSITASPIRTDTVVIGAVCVGRDITERKKAEQQLAEQALQLEVLALKDALTGLYNRRGLNILAEQHLKLAARKRLCPGLFFFDLNGMKPINDEYGHEAGDRVLREFAQVLKEVFRESDVLARLGGDEFVAFLPEAPPDSGTAVLTRLHAAIERHNAISGKPYWLSISAGYAALDRSCPKSLDELLADADAAMYQEKQDFRARERHGSGPVHEHATASGTRHAG